MIVYESKRPKFKISADTMQWILSIGTSRTYFTKLSLLLDELAEQLFRRNAKKLKDLRDLDKIVERVYRVNSALEEKFEKRLEEVFRK